jgi:hypothetical protein
MLVRTNELPPLAALQVMQHLLAPAAAVPSLLCLLEEGEVDPALPHLVAIHHPAGLLALQVGESEV